MSPLLLLLLLGGCQAEGAGGEEKRDGRLLGHRLGFLTGLHLGGAISSSGSLSASHSLNVFGKVMNTALSVSYGPNGYYQGPGHLGARPPLQPVGPGFGYQDDPGVSSTPSPDKGHEATAFLGLSASKKAAMSVVANPSQHGDGAGTQSDAPVHEVPDEGPPEVIAGQPGAGAGGEEVGEEPLPPEPPRSGLHFSAERRAQLEALARVRGPGDVEDQRRLFLLKHHNKHVAAFNQHHSKYQGDVSKVALFSRMKKGP